MNEAPGQSVYLANFLPYATYVHRSSLLISVFLYCIAEQGTTTVSATTTSEELIQPIQLEFAVK